MAVDGYRRMLGLVRALPGQLVEALELAGRVRLPAWPRPAAVMVAGMGGSAIGGDVIRGVLSDRCPVPVSVVRDYRLPATAGPGTLLFVVSYSGNTEETLATYHEGLRRRCRMVVTASGGELARLAENHGQPFFRVPAGLPPRAAIGYLTVPTAVVLDRAGIAKGLGRQVRRAAALLSARRAAWLRRARAVSARLVDRLPFVYSTSRLLDVVADRWRCQLNENAKTLCHTSLLPEHNHNEIVGMGCPEAVATRTVLLMLFDRGTHPRTARRMEHLLDITRSGYERALRLDAEGESEMERVFSLVMLGDMVSVELARRRGVDPLPVARIDELKRRMQRD